MKQPLPPTLILILLLAAVTVHARISPPWYEVSLGAGSTSNLFADSLGVTDQYGGLGLVLEQSLTPAWVIWYQGYGETFARTSDLGSLNHTFALETSAFVGERGEFWALGLTNLLGYSDSYELYNRQTMGVAAGYRYLADQTLRLRLNTRFNSTSFPNADTVHVDYREGTFSLGANVALHIPLSFDIEPGIQWRGYGNLDEPITTRYLWLSLRASTPITVETGLVARLLVRNQLDVGGQELLALARGGLDAGDMLWDGWQGGVTLNRMKGPWWLGVETELARSAYAQSVLYSGQPARTDDLFRASLRVRRALDPVPKRPRVTLEGAISWTNNRSTVGYYAYDGFSARIGVRVSPD